MKLKTPSLRKKITIFSVIIVLISILVTSSFFIFWTIKNVKENIGNNNLNLAISVGKSKTIGDLLKEKDPDKLIQEYAYNIATTLNDVDFLVIADMNKVRYSHINEDKLGQVFVGGDEEKALLGHDPYTSEAKGTLGDSVRAFSPIYDSNGNQTGFVAVGTLVEKVLIRQTETVKYIMLFTLGGLVLGIFGSLFLSLDIKRSLLGLEPEEIAVLYLEKETILDSLQESLISIDNDLNIIMINKPAKKMFDIADIDPIGMKITNFIDEDKINDLLSLGVVNQKEEFINNMEMVVNILPIEHNNKQVGTIATFKDRSEVRKLAEEITGYNQIVNALRANNHEFKNKLHVILGLIQIKEYDQAKKYILGIQQTDNYISKKLLSNITNPTVIALLYGKLSRANELGVTLEINESSNLEETTLPIYNRSLITIIGNLIDNSLNAVNDNENEKYVYLDIKDEADKVVITVCDNGRGIKEEDLKNVFNRGFTTSKDGSGIGLSLVKEKVEFFRGDIFIDSKENIGTKVVITLPKGDN